MFWQTSKYHLHAVVGPYLEVLDSELHRVVALLYLGVHLAGDAVPEHVVLGVLAVVVRDVVVVVVVGLAVVVPVVSHLALPAVAVVGAVVVGAVVVAHLVVHPVVGQGERGGRLLAGAVEVEVVVPLWLFRPVHLLVQVDVMLTPQV